MKLPPGRTDNLIEQDLDQETLIYDLVVNKAYTLNETSSINYKACDGETTFSELKHRHKFTDEFIYLALDELKRCKLLASDAGYLSPHAMLNRRGNHSQSRTRLDDGTAGNFGAYRSDRSKRRE